MLQQNISRFKITLTTAQVFILGYFILFHPIQQPFGPQDIVAYTLITAGILLGASSLFTRRQNHFRITQKSNSQAPFITHGPYTCIRHPIYTALIILTFGLFINYPAINHFLAFSLLFVVLNMKIINEEKLLTKRFPKYQEYQNSTHKLFPFLY